ncbi:DNA polymerase I [bacterium]|nr:DNA polymerase I [bacterium]
MVDISGYIFRAYYAIKSLNTSSGIPTNATYGVANMLLKLIREQRPDHLAIVFDSPTPSFRKEIYDEYKANRDAPPEDLKPQFFQVREFVETYPIPVLQKDGFEADDLIATFVKQYRERKLKGLKDDPLEIVIVSADKDLMQLVGDGVIIYDSMKDKEIDIPEVIERFGVPPHQVLEILSLAGDSSDNIPGVKGVGEKTATKLIQQYGSIENLYATMGSDISEKLREKLIFSKDNAFLSKKLASLHEEVPIELNWDKLELQPPDKAKLNSFFAKLELKRLFFADIPAPVSVAPLAISKQNYITILDEASFKSFLKQMEAASSFTFDTETTGLNPFTCHLVGLSFSFVAGEAFYIPLRHHYLGCPQQLESKMVLEALKPFFAKEKISKFAQNAKFDMKVLFQCGVEVKGLMGDSMLASYLISPESSHNMDYLASEYLQYKTQTYDDLVPKGQTIDAVEVEKVSFYAAEDADITGRLITVLHQKLKETGLWDCYTQLELPLVDVLFRMEKQGVYVDQVYLGELEKEFSSRLKEAEKKAHELAGFEFNLSSPKQLSEILFVKLQLPVQKKTKTGFSTDVDVLMALQDLHPLPKILLEHRMLSKLLSTYVIQLKELLNPETGRIHTSYNQTVAATGRLSSSDPNLQNIPIRSDEGRRIRKAFVAPPGFKIISADYSQIELRLLAELTLDPILVKAFQNNEDIHRITAAKLFNKKLEEITPDERARAKTVNFGILYGQSAFGLSDLLEIPQAEAKSYIEAFYEQYPSVMAYKEKVLAEAKEIGVVRTMLGRHRLVSDLRSDNKLKRQNAERMAFNTIFQGSAADLIKKAMIAIDQKLAAISSGSKMIMQVHDELVFEVPVADVEKVKEFVKGEMEGAFKTTVPLKVEVGVGSNWNDAH